MSMLVVHELHEARDRLLVLKRLLNDAKNRELPAYRELLSEQVREIDTALDQAKIPESYQVAVVGRFKVGKSSFVNHLAGERLAGVNANPETAAISVFRYGDSARAEIELISAEDWDRLREDYEEDAKSQIAKRYERFNHFNERPLRKSSDGTTIEREPVDLDQLIQTWVKPGGITHSIDAAEWGTKFAKQEFRKQVQKFTTSREPLHYLVNKLTIYAPIPILRDNIELIDTPGLDDTERFRVALTEDLVKDVDAILFLTVSGASYSASDKEFLVRQLRRKQIKHLQIIVTKCDETYENTCRDAEDEGDDIPTFEEFRAKEVGRVRSEVSQTLKELLEANQLDDEAGYYFIEQLDKVPTHLISTKYHDEGNHENGGIEGVRDGLYTVLSKSNRFEQSRNTLKKSLDQVLARLKRSFAERLDSLETEFDLTKVEAEIDSIRQLLSERLEEFETQTGESVRLLETQQEAIFNQLPLHLDLLESQAKEVMFELEKTDLAKHWKRRRYRGWGDLSDLQSQIADRIFPKVETVLNNLRCQLEQFMGTTGERLSELQAALEQVERQHQVSGLENLSLSDIFETRIGNLQTEFAGLAESSRDAIVTNLDDFISEEVLDKLEESRDEVSEIRGTGTTRKQTMEVEKFYKLLRKLLNNALREHVQERVHEFASSIVNSANAVYPRIRDASHHAIKKRLTAMQSALEVASMGQKDEVAGYLKEMLQNVECFAGNPNAHISRHPREGRINLTQLNLSDVTHGDKLVEQHYEIGEDATGFTYERIFCPYINSAKSIVVEDPYVNYAYQVENLTRFCALAVRLGVVESIELITKDWGGAGNDESDSRLETLRRDLRGREVEFNWRRSTEIHDREIRFENGWVVKIGRGLDIYKKPESWTSIAASDFSLRGCKQTKVDVYRQS
ncbi:MAG: hypothetical protein CMJ47_09155 [Planctomyces sp.]|nr:hypothetical protein [Planctomyces sp.]